MQKPHRTVLLGVTAFALAASGCGSQSRSATHSVATPSAAGPNLSVPTVDAAPSTRKRTRVQSSVAEPSLATAIAADGAGPFCGLLTPSTAANLVPGLPPNARIIADQMRVSAAASDSKECRYTAAGGTTSTAPVWLTLALLQPGVSLDRWRSLAPQQAWTNTSVAGHPGEYTLGGGNTNLLVELDGAALVVIPYVSALPPLPTASQDASIAEVVAKAVINGSVNPGAPRAGITKCFTNAAGEMEADVHVTGITGGWVAAVDIYAPNGQYETRIVANAFDSDDARATATGGPVDGKTFTCHLGTVVETSPHRLVYGTESPTPNTGGPPPGINIPSS